MDDFNSMDLSSTDDLTVLSRLYQDRMEGYGGPGNSSPLSSSAPWWVQVTEIGNGTTIEEIFKNIPKTRRGHSSILFRVSADRGLFKDDKELYVSFMI